jgi:mannose-6-phosphate isomerase-like protein (cupin superfamily)
MNDPRVAERVEKPWGHEEIFAVVEGSYVGKTLHVNAGQALSLQFHHHKDETIAVLSGQAQIDVGADEASLRTVDLPAGSSIHVPPGLLHRVRAVSDAVLVEASTAGPGWREDSCGSRTPTAGTARAHRDQNPQHPQRRADAMTRRTASARSARSACNAHLTRRPRSSLLVLLIALAMALSSLLAAAGPATAAPASAATAKPLTNLAHLNWLGATVRPPKQARHTTYQLKKHPRVGVLWTYAEIDGGVWTRKGGGDYDAATNTWGQGAFNADDISRAAVVYTRHWQLTGKKSSRKHARQLLRGLTYLQTATGPNRGNVVLWMQPDGTLNRSAIPVEQPDPSDSDAAYWTARTIWALGEGYAAFRDVDPKFASFLRTRLVLSMHAIDREVLDKYGTYNSLHGIPTPAWLIADGGDASSEAMLGLAAYVDAGGGHAARTTLRQLANGVAKLGGGNARTWPNGALLPWAMSRSDWHAWGADMPSGLARAGAALGDHSLIKPAIRDSATFTPWLLTSGGPDQARLPSRIDATQIAYGADARVQGLFATAKAAHRPGLRKVAGVAAAWFFGANLAHEPTYDPATGRTVDGVEKTGDVNRHSGAESTIHGLLTMLALDAHPKIAKIARTAGIRERVGTTTLQAEDATLTGGAIAVALTPETMWTGESQYGGTGYAELGNGGVATVTLPPGRGRVVVQPVVNLVHGSSAVTTVRTDTGTLVGKFSTGAVGAQGAAAAVGALLPVTLPITLSSAATTLVATTVAAGTDTAIIDAFQLEPVVSRYVLGKGKHGSALLRSADTSTDRSAVTVPGHGRLVVEVYDGRGRLVKRTHPGTAGTHTLTVRVLAGGFTFVRR